MSDITFNAKKSNKKKALLSALDDIQEDVLPSSLMKKTEESKKKSNKVEIIEDDSDTDKWLDMINNMNKSKISKKKKKKFKGFELDDETITKKVSKKKKKKKKGELTDYNSQFKPELSTLHNLQTQQARFVDSLQKSYDEIERSKSSARGIGKFTTDLIVAINGARSTSLQITNNIVNLKKTIADLTFKEKKEFGSKANSAEQDTAAFASRYLQEMLSAGRNNIVNQQAYVGTDIYESSDDELDNILNNSLNDMERDPAIDKYLEYEGKNVSVKVLYHAESGEHEFVAYDSQGIELCDYPLPSPDTKLSINLQTRVAKDDFSRKFDVIITE